MKTISNKSHFLLVIFLTIFLTGSLLSQDAKPIIFDDARRAYLSAIVKRADILSPNNFDNGIKYYEKANSDYKSGDDLKDIKENLNEATKYFEKSIEEIDVLEVLFAETLNARDDALDAEADFYEKELWNEAQEKFRDAAEEYEKGDSDDAKEEGNEAYDLYRKAELAAIKSHLFNNARDLITQAEDMKADKIVPNTFSKAKNSLEEGQKALEAERYDTDKPRMLAKKAEYEAKHAIYLVNYINKFEDKDKEVEYLLLRGESYLSDIGNALGLSVKFDKGSEVSTNKIISKINSLQDSIRRLDHLYNNSIRKNDHLQNQIAVLNQQLENMSDEQREQNREAVLIQKQLINQLEYDQEVNQKFEEIFRTFDESEAVVFRQENDIVLRMTGFYFDIGSAEVKPENYKVLSKVEKAINIFSDNQIIVQGHTDSQGGDKLNMKLSKERADAVRAYLIANMPNYDKSNISSMGYGESKPIANNESKFGRSKNRRIDIIIKVNEF